MEVMVLESFVPSSARCLSVTTVMPSVLTNSRNSETIYIFAYLLVNVLEDLTDHGLW